MLDLPDHWVWDFWLAQHEGLHHAFFLKAPRSLGDPELRHTNAVVGHATSPDLRTWTELPDALGPQPVPAYDDLATWTGCVVRDDDGAWRMFTSGVAREHGTLVQRIGVSLSDDLVSWRRTTGPVLEADDRWYAVRRHGPVIEHWRDPFVVRDAAGTWHMYVTASVPEVVGGGVVGHLVSEDLEGWEPRPPLSPPSGRFDQLEVLQLTQVEGRWVLVFSCLAPEMPGAEPGSGGVWSLAVDGPGAPVDLHAARRMTDERLYVGKVVEGPEGHALLAFRLTGEDGAFVGGVVDPVPVRWTADGGALELVPGTDWSPS